MGQRPQMSPDQGGVGGLSCAVDGRAWVTALALVPQRDLLLLLLDAVGSDERFRAVEVGGSLGRGNADEWSDIDVGLWIVDVEWDAALDDVEPMLRGLARVVDALSLERPWGKWIVQYADGRQLDVAVHCASTAKGRLADSVVLLDRDGILNNVYTPDSIERRDEWAFLAWFELGNVAKYLARESLWEALEALGQARLEFLRLHAANVGARDPQLGVSSIFDTPGGDIPPQLAQTYARAEPGDVRRAAGENGSAARRRARRTTACQLGASAALSQGTAPCASVLSFEEPDAVPVA